MEACLLALLQALIAIGENHEELYDSEVSEAMTAAIHDGFFKPVDSFSLPNEFGLHSDAGNQAVREALASFIERAIPIATEQTLDFKGRLALFQDSDITVGAAQIGYNDFFRYISPDDYDAEGNLLNP